MPEQSMSQAPHSWYRVEEDEVDVVADEDATIDALVGELLVEALGQRCDNARGPENDELVVEAAVGAYLERLGSAPSERES